MLRKMAVCLAVAAGLAFAQNTFEARMSAGGLAMKESRYPAAQKEFEAALTLSIAFDAADPRKAQPLEALSELNSLQGDYRTAEALGRQAVAIRERTLGAENAELAPYLARLAFILRAASKPDAAEPLVRRNLAMHEKTGDIAAASDYDQLAGILQAMNRFEPAVDAIEHALAVRTAKLGADHLEVAATFIALGALYQNGAKFGEAERAYLRALDISEKSVGAENFSLIGLLDRLGFLYRDASKFPQAEPYFQRGLALREKNLGPMHSDIAPALDNLALTYFRERKYDEAEPLYKRSLTIWEATQGKDSVFVALALDNLAALYATQGRLAKAEPLYLRALGIREDQIIGNSDTLALLYETTNVAAKAETFYKRAMLLGETGLGGDHPQISNTMENYATMLRALKRPAEAARVEARAKEIKAKALEKTKPAIGGPPPAVLVAAAQ
jgi:tetratricopeptide (TPR) repeat protein